jgi:hypothetical protein
LRNFKDHIYSIETVNLETFYKSMVERLWKVLEPSSSREQ